MLVTVLSVAIKGAIPSTPLKSREHSNASFAKTPYAFSVHHATLLLFSIAFQVQANGQTPREAQDSLVHGNQPVPIPTTQPFPHLQKGCLPT